MWIFGFGSLMSDGWEIAHGCTRRCEAVLNGFKRSFNKKSVKNWGTPESPGVTLNLEKEDGSHCHGIAFEFADLNSEKILTMLRKREDCEPTELEICLGDGTTVRTFTYIYAGPNLLSAATTDGEKARILISSKGTSGSGFEYVERVVNSLRLAGVEDAAVADLWEAVSKAKDGIAVP